VLQEDVVEVAAMVINVVTASGGEMLTTTPLELSVLDV
jgi:hypothetical protein